MWRRDRVIFHFYIFWSVGHPTIYCDELISTICNYKKESYFSLYSFWSVGHINYNKFSLFTIYFDELISIIEIVIFHFYSFWSVTKKCVYLLFIVMNWFQNYIWERYIVISFHFWHFWHKCHTYYNLYNVLTVYYDELNWFFN